MNKKLSKFCETMVHILDKLLEDGKITRKQYLEQVRLKKFYLGILSNKAKK